MRIYLAAAVLTTTYALVRTLQTASDPVSLVYSAVAGAMSSISLVLSTVPLAGPLLYRVALEAVMSGARFQVDQHFLAVMWAASWAINVAFTAALLLYALQVKRAVARRVIRALLV